MIEHEEVASNCNIINFKNLETVEQEKLRKFFTIVIVIGENITKIEKEAFYWGFNMIYLKLPKLMTI